jgi:choline-sulfatase
MCDQFQGRIFNTNNQCIKPNLDALANGGVRFENAYTPNAVCSPARASLMTGLLPHNHGVLFVTHLVDEDQSCLRLEKKHWAQCLEENNYKTGYFGKWHIERTNKLDSFGWQYYREMSTWMYTQKQMKLIQSIGIKSQYLLVKHVEEPPGYDKSNIHYGVTNVPPEYRSMGLIVDDALEFLDNALLQDKPWCCFVSIQEPHDPFICGEEALAQYNVNEIELPENIYDDLNGRPNIYKKAARVWKDMTDTQKKQAIACYYASITEIDQQYGRLIKKIRNSHQADNTIIIFTSDHGELLGAHGLYCKNFSGYEEVYNIPLIISGPGIKEGIVTSARVGLHDLCPTILELTGCKGIKDLDSKSFADVLHDPGKYRKEYKKGYAEYFGGRMLLTQRIVWNDPWKLVFNGYDFDELYNLHEDPYELNNLIDDYKYKDVVKEMFKQMWHTAKSTGDHSLYKSNYPILRVAPYGPLINEED